MAPNNASSADSATAGGKGGEWASSREFLDLVKAVGECTSKADEDRIVRAERERLRAILVSAKTPPPRKVMKEVMMRLVYVEMLGHEASFGYIHAVKLCCDTNPMLKRVGYLATSLFLTEGHELLMLIVNTLQRDLAAGDNDPGVACAALSALCSLRVGADAAGALTPAVQALLSHKEARVRKKAIMALNVMAKDDPLLAETLGSPLRAGLCDRDPSVMIASMAAIYELAVVEPAPLKPLVPSFISILRQTVQRRLPKSYEYHRVPAPFLQVRILKVLAALGASDQATSEQMYSALAEVIARARAGGSEALAAARNAGGKKHDKAHVAANDAIAYECVKTCASIYPNTALLKECMAIVGHFIRHPNRSVKYCGVEGLSCVIGVDPQYAAEHQMAVIDCLHDSDEMLVHKTLHLLHAMTSADNVETIVEHMTAFVGNTSGDMHARADIVRRIVELAERYAPSAQWYVETLNKVFDLGGDLVPESAAHNLMRLLAEGSGETEAADTAMRTTAVAAYVTMLRGNAKRLTALPLQVACWTLGEYGSLWSGGTAEVMELLCGVPERHEEDAEAARALALTAMTKLVSQGHNLSPVAEAFAKSALKSRSTDAQQRAYELQALRQLSPAARAAAIPLDGAAEDIDVDVGLGFLNTFVSDALANGAQPYSPPVDEIAQEALPPMSGGHDAPAYVPDHSYTQEEHVSSGGLDDLAAIAGGGAHEQPQPAVAVAPTEPTLNLAGTKGKWGMPAPPPSRPTPSPAASLDAGPGPSYADPIAAAPTAAPAPPQPYHSQPPPSQPVDPTKQRLAQSLFGGGGGSGPARRAASAAPMPAAAPPPPAAPAPQPSSIDLLMQLDAPTAPAAAPSAQPSSTNVMDQFAGMDIGTGMAAHPAPAAAPQVNLDALYGTPPQVQGAGQLPVHPSAKRAPLPAAPPAKKDPFADLGGF